MALGTPLKARTVASMSLDSSSKHPEPRSKRLRAFPSRVEPTSSLESLLKAVLPDKEEYHHDWLEALAAPSVCVTSLEDVQRLDPEDIGDLPVPPVVKAVLR